MKLSQVKKSAEKKYAPLPVELEDGREVLLRIPLRLTKEERKAITAAFEVDEETDSERDIMDIYEQVFRIVIESGDDADALIEALEGDLAFYQELFAEFSEAMQVGEQSSSKD